MRALISLAATLVLAFAFAVGITSGEQAVAGGCPDGTVPAPGPDNGTICVPAVDPGGGAGGGGGQNGGGGGPTTCQDGGKVIPCTTEFGVWFPSQGCYGAPLNPQPGAGEEVWGGHDPSEGKIYSCGIGSAAGGGAPWFVPNGAEPLPDPRELAQSALDQLNLETPNIKIAPAPPLATYVGLETWLWIPEAQWRDLSLTVTAGNTSVTVVAAPKRVDWDLTAGTTSCYSAGREWIKGMSSNAQTNCSYTFSKLSDDQPEEKFPITATLIYSATWTCSGACTSPNGDLGDVPSLQGNAAIEVNERQSVIKNRP